MGSNGASLCILHLCISLFGKLEEGTTLTLYFMRTVFLVERRLYVAHLFPLKRSRKLKKSRYVEPGIMLFQRGNICNFRFIFISASKKYHMASQYLVFRFITQVLSTTEYKSL